MKIDYAVVSSDDSEYLDYWPCVAAAWRQIGITPVLMYVGTRTDLTYFRRYNLPPISGIKPSLQAQIARIWAFKLLQGNCILSDIDMMPLSGQYFHGTAEPYAEDTIVSYCADGRDKFGQYHPICYVLANSAVMAPLIEQPDWETFVRDLAQRGGEGWFTDQWWLTKLMEQHGKIACINRGFGTNGAADRRLDRRVGGYREEDLREGKFVDAHLPRPFHRYREEIERLVNLVGNTRDL